MTPPRVVACRDADLLAAHFAIAPVLFAYHLGDLDPFFFDRCQWLGWQDDRGLLSEIILIYHGPELPTVLIFGLSPQLPIFLEATMPNLPDQFYCHYMPSEEPILSAEFRVRPLGTHLKMTLGKFAPAAENGTFEVRRLARRHLGQLQKLYDVAYPNCYFDVRMLDTCKCFGILDMDEMIAAVGVHVYLRQGCIAVLGIVATHPRYRNRGLATTLTSQLTQELVGKNLRVCLNVKADNQAAISCYRKLGFEPYREYREAVFARVNRDLGNPD